MMNFYIDKISVENYTKFEDMIYWRINQTQRTPSTNKPKDSILNELSNPNLYIYALGVNAVYVGWISLIYMPKVGRFDGHGHIYVDELWIEPTYRNNGFAKKLLAKADELKRSLSATGVRLYVNQNNPNAKNLYIKCGFKENGKAIFMEK